MDRALFLPSLWLSLLELRASRLDFQPVISTVGSPSSSIVIVNIFIERF